MIIYVVIPETYSVNSICTYAELFRLLKRLIVRSHLFTVQFSIFNIGIDEWTQHPLTVKSRYTFNVCGIN